MPRHQSGKALVVGTHQFAPSEALQAEGEVDVSEERSWKAGIDEGLEALDMQAGRIRLAAGDLTDLVLSQLGGEDENSISQGTKLACFIDNRTMAPDPLEARAEDRVGLINILKHEHAVMAVLQGLQ